MSLNVIMPPGQEYYWMRCKYINVPRMFINKIQNISNVHRAMSDKKLRIPTKAASQRTQMSG